TAWLETVYLFGTGAAVLVGAVGLLLALQPTMQWHQRAPLVMLVPIAYLVAARLYRGRGPEQPLTWVAHTGAVVMLLSSLFTTVSGFTVVTQNAINLALAGFFAEAALFYALDARFRQARWAVSAATLMGCATVWQLLSWLGVAPDVYILTFAGLGLA